MITAELNGDVHGMTANAFMSVSLVPPLVVVSIDNRAHMNRMLLAGHNFGVSILSEEQEVLSNHFAGRPVEGLPIQFVRPTGTPLIKEASAHLVARIVQMYPVGDHTLYVGAVEYVAWREGRPLLFYSGRYHHLMPDRSSADNWPEDEMSLFSIGNYDQKISKVPRRNDD